MPKGFCYFPASTDVVWYISRKFEASSNADTQLTLV